MKAVLTQERERERVERERRRVEREERMDVDVSASTSAVDGAERDDAAEGSEEAIKEKKDGLEEEEELPTCAYMRCSMPT